MAKKQIGAMILLKAKKYWTLAELVRSINRGGLIARPYFSIRYAQEGKLKQEVKHKATHSCRGDALVLGYVVGDVGIARPDGCEQDGHALTASRGLDTVYI